MASSEELRRQLEELQETLKEAKEVLSPVQDTMQELDALIFTTQQNFQDQINQLQVAKQLAVNELNEQKKKHQAEVYEAQVAFNQAKWAAEDAAKELEAQILAEETVAKEEQMALLKLMADIEAQAKFDKMTIAAPWREWAKEHQMSGARKMMEDRYVINADGMGLGKTLTSIIAMEYAEKASIDASPELPWLGQVENQFIPEKYVDKATGEELTGWFGYDKKQKMQNDPEIEYTAGHYEDVVVNAIERPVGRRVLYLCPASLLTNVLSEFRHWTPHRNATYIGGFTKAERNWVLGQVTQLGDYVIICNYEAWRRDKALLDTLNSLEFDTIVIDEAHNIKNPKSVGFKGVQALCNGERRPEFIFPMTGTPILNRPQELYPLLHIVNPKEFYNENTYLRSYCEQYYNKDGQLRWRFQDGGLERLSKRISKNFIRRTRDDAGIELPPKTITLHQLEVDVEAYPNQARARDQMRRFATIKISETKALSAMAKIAIIGRLRQIETWPAGIKQIDANTKEVILQVDIEESQKLDYVMGWDKEEGEWDGLIPQLVQGERIVVFSQFIAPLMELEKRIRDFGYNPAVLTGSTTKDERERIRVDFDNRFTPKREDSVYDVALCHYKVGGVGLNMTGATQMIILDEEWNPSKRDQAYDRIHRMGQDKPVTVHLLRNTPTIDNWLAGLMTEKEAIVDGFEEAMENATSGNSLMEALDSGLI